MLMWKILIIHQSHHPDFVQILKSANFDFLFLTFSFDPFS